MRALAGRGKVPSGRKVTVGRIREVGSVAALQRGGLWEGGPAGWGICWCRKLTVSSFRYDLLGDGIDGNRNRKPFGPYQGPQRGASWPTLLLPWTGLAFSEGQ